MRDLPLPPPSSITEVDLQTDSKVNWIKVVAKGIFQLFFFFFLAPVSLYSKEQHKTQIPKSARSTGWDPPFVVIRRATLSCQRAKWSPPLISVSGQNRHWLVVDASASEYLHKTYHGSHPWYVREEGARKTIKKACWPHSGAPGLNGPGSSTSLEWTSTWDRIPAYTIPTGAWVEYLVNCQIDRLQNCHSRSDSTVNQAGESNKN